MNTRTFLFGVVFLSALLGLVDPGYTRPQQDSDGIVFTWQDLQKLLDLNTDKIKINWQDFKKLLVQSGNLVKMNFPVQGGMVTLTRKQFKDILDRMRSRVTKIIKPPLEYLVSEALYSGTTGAENSRFQAEFKIYLFQQEKPAYVKIPLLNSVMTALESIQIDGKPAMIHTSDCHYITLQKPGFHTITAVFGVKQIQQTVVLPVVKSIVTRLDFRVFGMDAEISVNPSLNVRRTFSASETMIRANLPATGQFSISWNRRGKKAEKKPALFYARTNSLISVEPDILKIKTRVDLEIVQSSLDKVSLRVPEHHEIVKVNAGRGSNWQLRETDIGRVLEIDFGYDANHSLSLTVDTERMLANDTLAVDYDGLSVIDARRETGNLGVVAQSAVEVVVKPDEKLEKINFHQLPQSILAMTPRPILYSYKYSKPPCKLHILISKHQPITGLATVIESADILVLFQEGGKVLTRIDFMVKNSYKQFLELKLPRNSVIWSVIVNNRRGKPSLNQKGNILIPLIRSTGNGENLKSFKTEVVYSVPGSEFGISGNRECILPVTDILINKMTLGMFLPEGYSYSIDQGKWKEMVSLQSPLKSNLPRIAEKKKKVREELPGKKQPRAKSGKQTRKDSPLVYGLDGSDIEGGVTGDEKISGDPSGDRVRNLSRLTGPAGLDSVRVNLPLSGKHYVFTKKIVDKGEHYPFRFSYFRRSLKNLIVFSVAGLAILVLVFLGIHRIKKKK